MSSCLSGGGRTYGLDLEIIKSPSTCCARSSQTSSPSSTLSESSNSPLAISTRKPRTPRKRPNQTYNEAAALLSTAYPTIFSTKNLTKLPGKLTNKPHDYYAFFPDSSSDQILLPFRVIHDSGFLLQNHHHHQQPIQEKPSFLIGPKGVNCRGEVNSHGAGAGGVSMEMELEFSPEFQEEDFDAESILDEEIEEGIDNIMGNLNVSQETLDESSPSSHIGSWYGNPMGLGLGFGGKFDLGFGLGLRRGVRALRNVDEGNWWNFPTVDVLQISPKSKTAGAKAATTATAATTRRAEKKKNKVEKPAGVVESKNSENPKENPIPFPIHGLQLKLNYEDVVNAWSDRGCPFSEESPAGTGSPPGTDIYARLAQIDLFSEGGGGMREASVLRYKEKRRTRLFSKKIRYQVRKVNADRRPRMKGRFVRRPNSSTTTERSKKEIKRYML